MRPAHSIFAGVFSANELDEIRLNGLSHLMVPILETPRTRLRGHRLSDLAASARMWRDERVVHYISGVPSSVAESWSRLLVYAGHWQFRNFGYWVVEDRETGEFLGEVGFADFKRDIVPSLNGLPEIGWVLAPSAHGRGIATEAAEAATRWGDQFLGSDTCCILDPKHAASKRVAQKLGYNEKGLAIYKRQPTLVMERLRRP